MTVPEWKLVGEAVNDGIRQIYDSNKDLRQISRVQGSNPDDLDRHQDLLTYHLPRVIFNVDVDTDSKLESVDASDSTNAWLSRENRAVLESNHHNRHHRRKLIRSIPGPGMDSTTSQKGQVLQRSRCSSCCKGFLTLSLIHI